MIQGGRLAYYTTTYNETSMRAYMYTFPPRAGNVLNAPNGYKVQEAKSGVKMTMKEEQKSSSASYNYALVNFGEKNQTFQIVFKLSSLLLQISKGLLIISFALFLVL